MADVRYTTLVRDDFQRADENPIGAPWDRNWSAGIDCQIDSNIFKSTSSNPSNSGQMFWSTEDFSGDEIEVWAAAVGNAPQADSYRIGLCDDSASMNGYLLRCENPVGADAWTIRKYTGGSFGTLAQTRPAQLPSSDHLVLMQLTATHVNCYLSDDTAGTSWTLIVSAADTDYRSGLYIHLGGNGAPGWTYVGGGVPDLSMPEFIRRPWEYQGVPLEP